MRIVLQNGSPVLISADKGTSFRPLAQLIVDGETTSGARDDTRNRGGRGVRAAHLGFAGTVAKQLVYQFETEFASGSAAARHCPSPSPTSWPAPSRRIAAASASVRRHG